jgi:transcriptional regulator with XRE-family HTH domain
VKGARRLPRGESLTELLQKYGERVRRLKGKEQAQMARDAWLDESYVSRLFSGERANPSRDALILLGNWGLELAVEEVDELLMAAIYKPLVLPASIR